VFEVTREEPRVAVADRRYKFNVDDENAMGAVAQKQQQDEQQVAELVAKGVPPIKLVYDDGGGHESFQQALASATDGGPLVVDARLQNRLGDVSRPEALSAGPREIVLDDSGRPKQEAPSTALAFAAARNLPTITPAEPAQALPAQALPAPAPVAQARAAPVAVAHAKPAPASPTVTAQARTLPSQAARAKATAPVVVATAAPVRQPVQAAAAEETPLYKKVFSGIGDLFSTSHTAAPDETAQPAANAPARSPGLKPQASMRTSTNVAIAN
jgi:hypothetical protein